VIRSLTAAVLLALAVFRAFADTNELDVAKSALRDGLWDVARRHAGVVESDEARLLVLESLAREGKWSELLSAHDGMGYPVGDGFVYYRALALCRSGSAEAASNVLVKARFSDPGYARPAARLRAELAMAAGRIDVALEELVQAGGEDPDTKLMMADLRQRDGDREVALRLWRDVLAATNAPERVRAVAAVGLGDAAVISNLLATVTSGEVRRFLNFNLGMVQLSSESSFAEGERRIRDAVRDSPDAEGAREAFYALASRRLARKEFAAAAAVYADALEIWPEASKDPALHEGRGMAFSQLGRTDEAVAEFLRTEELSADPERKARAAARAADVLSVAGRVKEATAVYQRVRDAYPDTVTSARLADVLRLREAEERARELYAAFRFDEARIEFERLAKLDAANADRLSLYCVMCVYGIGDDEAAERLATGLAASAVDVNVRAQVSLWLAKYNYNRSRWREARSLFDAYVKLAPRSADAPQALVWSARASLADNDFAGVLSTVARLLADYPDSVYRAAGMMVQGEALIELARFDEAVLVLERTLLVPGVVKEDRIRAGLLRADALFAMGADNPVRYEAALEAYSSLRNGESLPAGQELMVSFKMARTLDKLKRREEAVDMYYSKVLLAYRAGRLAGIAYDDLARATFARAAFLLAEEFESRGRIRQAVHVLDLVRTSDVPAADEAVRRIDRLTRKGVFP